VAASITLVLAWDDDIVPLVVLNQTLISFVCIDTSVAAFITFPTLTITSTSPLLLVPIIDAASSIRLITSSASGCNSSVTINRKTSTIQGA
jgi:hypothetical protein